MNGEMSSCASYEAFKRNSVTYAFFLELIDLSDQVGLFPLQAIEVFLELHPLLLPLIDPLLQSLDATLVDYGWATGKCQYRAGQGTGRKGSASAPVELRILARCRARKSC